MPNSSNTEATLVYVHDPMCSWCWGFRPTFEALCSQLPAQIRFVRLLGGLAPDNESPMPQALRQQLQNTWRTIQARIPGTSFNFDFWEHCTPQRSTYPSCRAVLTARTLDAAKEEAMILAIQQAYYLQARNPSRLDTLIELGVECGFAEEAFARTLHSPEIDLQLSAEMTQARKLGVNSYPSLVVVKQGHIHPISIDYKDSQIMLHGITDAADLNSQENTL